MEAAWQEHQARRVLALPARTPKEIDRAISEARLFLLAFPGSAPADRVKAFLETLAASRRQEEWAAARAAVHRESADPSTAIDLIHRFQCRWPDWQSDELEAELKKHHLALFKKAWADLDVMETGTLVSRDGRELAGRIELGGSRLLVADPVTGSRSSIPAGQVKELRLNPGPGTWQELTSAVQAMDAAKVGAEDLALLLNKLESNGLATAALLVRRLLAALRGQDAESAAALSAAGCALVRGRWLTPHEQTPQARIDRLLNRHRREIVEEIAREMAALDLRLTFQGLQLPVRCDLRVDRLEIKRVSEPHQPLRAAAELVFQPGVELRDEARQLIGDARTARNLNLSLRQLQDGLECAAEIQIEEAAAAWLGVDLESPTPPRGWRLSEVSPGSVADRAWLEKGDELLAVNHVQLSASMTRKEVDELLSQAAADTAELRLSRRGQIFTVQVRPDAPPHFSLKIRYRIRHNIGKGGLRQFGEWRTILSAG